MNFSWLESIIYAFVAGATEFMPVSSHAHRSLLKNIFSADANTSVVDFLIHFAVLLACIFCCQSQLASLNRTRRLLAVPLRRRKQNPTVDVSAKYRLIRSATVPVLIYTVFFNIANTVAARLNIMALCLLINGIIMYATSLIRTANKTAGQMSRIDGLLIGFISGLGIIPGFSRVGLGLSICSIRGAKLSDALDWMLVLSIPALIGVCITDLIVMFTVGVGVFSFILLLQCLLSAFVAYVGAYLAIMLLRYLSARFNLAWFGLYCWGAALFSFILFMI